MTVTGMNGATYILNPTPVSSGGEGDIFRVVFNKDAPAHVAKIYKPGVATPELEAKLKIMLVHPPEASVLSQVAWPRDVLYDTNKQFCGFVMAELNINAELGDIYKYPPSLSVSSHQKLIIAQNICAVISAVHKAGYAFGDFNPRNIGLDTQTGLVSFLDTDTYHVFNPEQNTTYRCNVCAPGYAAPELLEKVSNYLTENPAASKNAYAQTPLPTFTQETDNFALAIHIFKLLMNGYTPFGGIIESASVSQSSPGVGDAAVRRNSYCFRPGYKPQSVAIPDLDALPEEMETLFTKAFINGREHPQNRPNANTWHGALSRYEKELVTCGKNEQHQYHKKNRSCPLCEADKRFAGVMGDTSLTQAIPQRMFTPPPPVVNVPAAVNASPPVQPQQSQPQPQQMTNTFIQARNNKRMITFFFVWLMVVGTILFLLWWQGGPPGTHRNEPQFSDSVHAEFPVYTAYYPQASPTPEAAPYPTPEATPTPTPAPTPTPHPTFPGSILSRGDTGDMVETIQNQLNIISGVHGETALVNANGSFGSGTMVAVIQIQHMLGLPVTGEIDRTTWNRIFAFFDSPPVRTVRGGLPFSYYVVATVNLRALPNTDSDVLEVVQRGSIVQVTNYRDNEWFAVSYGNRHGYIRGEFLLRRHLYEQHGHLFNPNSNTNIAPALISVGTVLPFGSHHWHVLDVVGDYALLLTQSVVERRHYHTAWESVTWASSDIRRYLNGAFLEQFSQTERTFIRETNVFTHNNPWFGSVGGNVTTDRVFLLSLDEVVRYFGDSGQLRHRLNMYKTALDDAFNHYRIAYDFWGTPTWWWLRSPGELNTSAAFVSAIGTIGMDGGGLSGDWGHGGGVRPALWLRMNIVG